MARFTDCVGARDALLPRLLADLARHANVHGLGIGFKEACGVPTDTLAVRVHVSRKRSRDDVAPQTRIPSFIDGVPIDVVVSPRASLCSSAAGGGVGPPAGALASGMSVGRDGVPFGTLGAVCMSTRSDEAGQVFVLSNNHVFANMTGQPGDPIFHPGPGDAGGARNRIGELARAFPIEPGGTIANQVDAAVARLDPIMIPSPIVQPIGPLRGRTFARAGTTVGKHGRTTRYTLGRISDVNHSEIIGLNVSNRRQVALFRNQIRIVPIGRGPFAQHGDSGSLVVEPDTALAVGLFFAGPFDGSYGLANDITTVLERLEISLLL